MPQRLAFVASGLIVSLTAMPGPARADWRDERRFDRHERWEHERWEHRPGYGRYYPGPGYYAPPPVYYAPPRAYYPPPPYAPPGVGLIVPYR